MTNLDSFLATSNCSVKPYMLIFEKLRVKVGDSSRKYLKNISVSLFDGIQNLFNF